MTNNLREFHKAVHRALCRKVCVPIQEKKSQETRKKVNGERRREIFLQSLQRSKNIPHHQSQSVWITFVVVLVKLRIDVIRITLSSHVAATTRHPSSRVSRKNLLPLASVRDCSGAPQRPDNTIYRLGFSSNERQITNGPRRRSVSVIRTRRSRE